ncbi:MAG: hypothetical protein ACI82F_000823 [Planctomycetota bacterium]|jgi:hypothetical protein
MHNLFGAVGGADGDFNFSGRKLFEERALSGGKTVNLGIPARRVQAEFNVAVPVLSRKSADISTAVAGVMKAGLRWMRPRRPGHS